MVLFAVSPSVNFEWVKPHLPTARHKTHYLLFNLARAILTQEKKLGRGFTTMETKAIFDHWHQSADPMFLSQSRTVYFSEFLEKRHYAKKPLDEGTLQAAWEAAKTKPPPPETEGLADVVRQLASLCRELSTGRNPFFLSNRSAAALLGVDAMAVNRSLHMLCGLRVLECVEKGKLVDRRASEYRYHGNP